MYEDVASGKVSLQQLLAVTQQNPANQLANPTSQPDMIAGSLTSNSLTFNWLADTKLLPLLDSSRDITKIAARRLLLELGWSASIKLGEISSKNAKLLTQNPALQNPAPKKSSKT